MNRRQKRNLLRIAASVVFLVLGLLIPGRIVSLVFLFTAYFVAGYDVIKKAVEGILHGQVFDENFLMAIATVGAICIGEYTEAVAVMLLYQIGEWFQQYAVRQSRASISDLMDIQPETATVERNGGLQTLDPEEVEVDDILIVHPGERIAVDGIVIEGRSSLNTAALTGESLPRDVAEGDSVISGCINENGLLRIRASKPYADSTVSRILELVENASDKKAKVESFITRFARIYTPLVCIAALLLFVIPPLFFAQSWLDWGYRALSFLVVSCPCALVISVPLTFFGGIGGASRRGILVKGSNYLEALAKAQTVVFDKTGTLTYGQFRVSTVQAVGTNKNELLRIAAAVESGSTHPISRSICEAWTEPIELGLVSDVQEKTGLGIKALYSGKTVLVGSDKLMQHEGIQISESPAVGTVIHVAFDSKYLGYIVIEDEIKSEAASAIRRLKDAGIQKTVMLSGDTVSVAQNVAKRLGIDEVHAQLLPEGKMNRLEELLRKQTAGSTLVYVGDGMNDAPVLSRADVGIAMGALGSDAAIEAADIVLMDDDPAKVALAVQISRRTLGIARQNIVFALAVKLAVLVLVAIGCSGMWLAIFADVGVSVLAILNAMRALNTYQQ